MSASRRISFGFMVGASCVAALLAAACPSTDALWSGNPDLRDVTTEEATTAPDVVVAPSGCTLAEPPGPPNVADVPGGDPIVLAIRKFTGSPDYEVGFDLDGTCTCDDAGPPVSADGGEEPCRASSEPDPTKIFNSCDRRGGRDVATVKLLEGAFYQGTFFEESNDNVAQGRQTLILELRDYNGASDDPSVKLAVYFSHGIWPTTSDGGAFLDDAGALPDGGNASTIPPSWDGEDRWTIDPDTTIGGKPIAQTAGYVTQSTLVVRAERLPGLLATALGLSINGAIITGVLQKTVNGLWSLERGQLAGRVHASQINGAFRLQRPTPRECVIAELPAYGLIKQSICASRDVMELGRDDRTGKTCDSVSYLGAFSAEQAKIGLFRGALYQCPNADDPCP